MNVKLLVLAGFISGALVSATGFILELPVTADTQTVDAWRTNQYQLGGTLFMQKASEYRALTFQAFNIARLSLDTDEKTRRKLPKSERKKPCSVMVDIDETVLDNSPFQAVSIRNNLLFDLQRWYAWGEMRRANAIPGAVEFLTYASRRRCRIFYASNRDLIQERATIDNLKSAGFPDVSEDSVLLRDKDSSKEARRQEVSEKYRIVLLIGDNLNDFADSFENKNVTDRFDETDKSRAMFGTKWIVLPNVMYGDWEDSLYDYKRLSADVKADRRKDALEGY